jgi:hypothetical protein
MATYYEEKYEEKYEENNEENQIANVGEIERRKGFSPILNEIIDLSVNASAFSFQLTGFKRSRQAIEYNADVISEWSSYMIQLRGEILKLKKEKKIDEMEYVIKLLKTKANGVYECYASWVEKSGVFRGYKYPDNI